MLVPCRYRSADVPLLPAPIGDIAVIYDLLLRASGDLISRQTVSVNGFQYPRKAGVTGLLAVPVAMLA
jgi:hypothetical protein